MAARKQPKPEDERKETLPEEEQRRLVDDAIEKSEKLAESQLEMARLFLAHGKRDVARRRLEDLLERYSRSEAAKESRRILKTIKAG